MKVIEIEQNFHFFIFSSPHEIIYVLFAGQRENCYCGDHNFLRKHSKNMAFKGD